MFRNLLFFIIFALTVSGTEFMTPCSQDAECHQVFNSSYVCQQKKCQHEAMMPFSTTKILGLIFIYFITILTNSAGIGGGAILVPVYTFVFNFTVGGAIPLSKATILSGAIVNLALNHNTRKTSNWKKLLIDFNLVSFIVPLILAGTMIGVVLTKLLPAILIFVFLVGYLWMSSIKTYKKAKQLHVQEEQGNLLSESNQDNLMELKDSKVQGQREQIEQNQQFEMQSDCEKQESSQDFSFERLFRPNKNNMVICVFLFLLIVVGSMIRGGHGMKSVVGLDTCSLLAWLVFVIVQLVCMFGSFRIYKQKVQWEIRSENQFQENEEEQDEDEKLINSGLFRDLSLNSYTAGILAGTLGIGGGLVINPVLLKQGISPQVSAAVSATVVLFTSMGTTSQFIIAGAIDFYFAIWIILVSALGSLTGNLIFKRIMQKYNKPSIVVWVLFGLIGSSAIILPLVGGFKILSQKHVFNFGSPC